jgi:Bacterial extracellular solute-binding protein
MGVFTHGDGALEWRGGHETVRIEPWGPDSLRVRGTLWERVRDDLPGALIPAGPVPVSIEVGTGAARVTNGALTAEISASGQLRFLRPSGEELLAETTPHFTGPPTRRYTSAGGGMHHFEVRFAARDGERCYGLGQHQHGRLDQKGAVIELVQRNTEVSIPFLLSSLGYGFLWNHPSAGDMPSLVLLDNPNVPQVAATGQLRAFNDLPGFTTSGYYPGAISECTYRGKQYCYPIGTNSVGLFYNKSMLAAAGLQPPTTWDELAADAKKLTKPPVYGMAFDATADEQSTWQLEPFFWSAGASLTKVDTPPFQSALQLWVDMVKAGSASKSVLNWGQDPDLTQQFIQGHAAMMVNGPWIFPELNQKGWKYNEQYGIVPIPTDKAGQTVVAPLGGETVDLGTGGSDQQQKLAWEWVQGMQATSTMEHVTSLMYYLPTKPAVTEQVLKGGQEYTVFAKETQTARSRTKEYAPTTRRCRRPSGPRSRPPSPAPRR